jgi:hypothetical protein
MRTRSLLVLGISTTLAALAPFMSNTASAEPAPRAAVAPTQAFSGSGAGTFDSSFRDEPTYAGHYQSTGQLGSGSFVIDAGIHTSAVFTRSDGTKLTGTSVVNVPFGCGTVLKGADCLHVDVTGTSDIERGQLQVEALVSSVHVGIFGLATTFTINGVLTLDHRIGYLMVDANGTTFAFGGIDHLGNAPTSHAIDVERTPSGLGYWIVNESGSVYAFGDAPYLGNAPSATFAPGEVVTSMSATPTGKGYWLFTSTGRVFTFGDARSFGDLRALPLNGRIIGSVATPTGLGYYMVGTDGGVFAFGDARFRGSMGNARLNRPVVGLVPTQDNAGYWLVASDGGVFSFDASFFGSTGGIRLNQPIVAMVPYGRAYLMVASDGGVFNFSRSPFFGSEGGTAIAAPVVNGAAAS